MFKRLVVMALSIALIGTIGVFNNKPIFNDYASCYEVYVGTQSSNAKIISVTKNTYSLIHNKVGESCKINGVFYLREFLSSMNAELVFKEDTEEGTSYYAYSNRIRYKRTVCGKVVNLHVFIGKSGVTVGSPIIYGSF